MKNLTKIKLPEKPGVYLFKKNKTILYIGKATSLRDRVRSYMSKRLFDMRGPLVEKMVLEANKINWEVTENVLEAMILEANLIKKHQPYYNTKEKDDKSFNYVCITREKISKVLVVRGKELQNYKGSFFGPYTNGSQLKTALQIIRKIFPFIDEASSKKANIEFYKQIHLTPANTEEYIHNIKNLKLFLQGKKKDVLKNLKKDMISFAKDERFEEAQEIKRQLFALQHINDIALLKYPYPASPYVGGGALKFLKGGRGRIEAYDIAHISGKSMVGAMTVIENGYVAKNEYRRFRIRTQAGPNDTGALAEVLERRLTHREWVYPDLIVVDGGMAQIHAFQNVLKKAGVNIIMVSVLKDDRHKPKDILGNAEYAKKYKREILLSNSEAHRFAITYHKNMRAKSFLK